MRRLLKKKSSASKGNKLLHALASGSIEVSDFNLISSDKYDTELDSQRWNSDPRNLWPSGVHAPVDGVEEQVGQRERQTRVRIYQVAVADQQIHVFSYGPLSAESSPLYGPRVWHLGWSGERVRSQGGCHAREWSQLHLIVMETAIKGHCLGGIKGGWNLKQHRSLLIIYYW